VGRLVERTLEEDKQLVYAFSSTRSTSLGFARARGDQGRRRLETARHRWQGREEPGVQVIDRHVLGQNVFEFSIAVVDDKGSRLGRLTYGCRTVPCRRP